MSAGRQVKMLGYVPVVRPGMCRFVLVGCLVLSVCGPGFATAQLAFPGAEGAGAAAKGGRGGDVYYVTNLYDYTTSTDPNRFGTLRYGIASASGPRTIVFKVAGYIDLKSSLSISKTNITIAGQTAPGNGICLRNYPLLVSANDVVIRHIRVRLGTNALQEADSIWITGGQRIILDHCTASWSVDETLSATESPRDLTVQWSFITESLNNSIHSKGRHGYASLITPKLPTVFSWHHNFYAHHYSRVPRTGSGVSNLLWTFDFRNNVVYNWGDRAGYSGGTNEYVQMNYVNNVFLAGPDKDYNYAFQGGGSTTWIYQQGNLIDITLDGVFNPTNSGWGMFSGTYSPTNAPFSCPAVTTEPASNALLKVLVLGGALPWRRDSLDRRIANDVFAGTGRIIDYPDQAGGWPVLQSEPAPVDSDSDGMPDYWELAMGLNPANAADRNLVNSEGYTRLEEYLNWKGAPHAMCDRNGTTTINLREMFGGLTNVMYQVVAVSNCTVSLAPDGYTLQFTAARKYTGLAAFLVSLTNRSWRIGCGPVPVVVLITTTNAPNNPPEFVQLRDVVVMAGSVATNLCVAMDPDLPAQQLTYALVEGPPGATIEPETGVFRWPVPITWSVRTNSVVVSVSDDGEPPRSSTGTFSVIVEPLPRPRIASCVVTGPGVGLRIDGVPGLKYQIQCSTNLVDWVGLYTTNAAQMPFEWTDWSLGADPMRFYRVAIVP